MEKLNQIIESMALAQFKSDTRGTDKQNAFMLEHATIGELFKYFSTKVDSNNGRTWLDQYKNTKIGNMQGLTESFLREVVWVRLKDRYIEDAVKSLEQKVEQSFKITIESI
jgi:hypothetical protein